VELDPEPVPIIPEAPQDPPVDLDLDPADPPADAVPFVVDKPKFGFLARISPGKQVPTVGGKPKPDFTWLEARDPDSAVIAARHRPKDTAASTKAYDARIKGLTPAFDAGGNLKDFMESVDKHLVKHGLDTIAYIPDPSDKTKILSAVTQYPLLNFKKADHVLMGRFSLYDGFAKCDDTEAVEFLLSSVNKGLKTHLRPPAKGSRSPSTSPTWSPSAARERRSTSSESRRDSRRSSRRSILVRTST
jgi:hypothetical protein